VPSALPRCSVQLDFGCIWLCKHSAIRRPRVVDIYRQNGGGGEEEGEDCRARLEAFTIKLLA